MVNVKVSVPPSSTEAPEMEMSDLRQTGGSELYVRFGALVVVAICIYRAVPGGKAVGGFRFSKFNRRILSKSCGVVTSVRLRLHVRVVGGDASWSRKMVWVGLSHLNVTRMPPPAVVDLRIIP